MHYARRPLIGSAIGRCLATRDPYLTKIRPGDGSALRGPDICILRSRGIDMRRIVRSFSSDTGLNDVLVHAYVCRRQ